jgi:uncharacterized protein YecT (DUF1311 family)
LSGLLAVLTGAVLFFSAPVMINVAQAQSAAECISPQTQMMMNMCAAEAYQVADAALNEAWTPAKAFADAIGKGEELLDAQRAWLAYRDAACVAHSSPYEGGSIRPMIHSICLSELTEQRTAMLLEFHAY